MKGKSVLLICYLESAIWSFPLPAPGNLGPEFVRTLKRLLVRSALVLAPFLLLSALRVPAPRRVARRRRSARRRPTRSSCSAARRTSGRSKRSSCIKEGWAPRIYLFRQIADWGERELIERGFPYPREVDLQIDVMGRLGVPEAGDRHPRSGQQHRRGSRRTCYALATRETLLARDRRHLEAAHAPRAAGDEPPAGRHRRRGDRAREPVRSIGRRSLVANRSTLRFTLFETQRLLGYWIGVRLIEVAWESTRFRRGRRPMPVRLTTRRCTPTRRSALAEAPGSRTQPAPQGGSDRF